MPLTHTVLLVRDFEASFNFYSDCLDFEVVTGDRGGPMAVFSSGDARLGIFDRSKRPELFGEFREPAATTSPLFILAVWVDDVDKVITGLRERDVGIALDPTDFAGFGYRSALCLDPDHNRIELYQPILPG